MMQIPFSTRPSPEEIQRAYEWKSELPYILSNTASSLAPCCVFHEITAQSLLSFHLHISLKEQIFHIDIKRHNDAHTDTFTLIPDVYFDQSGDRIFHLMAHSQPTQPHLSKVETTCRRCLLRCAQWWTTSNRRMCVYNFAGIEGVGNHCRPTCGGVCTIFTLGLIYILR